MGKYNRITRTRKLVKLTAKLEEDVNDHKNDVAVYVKGIEEPKKTTRKPKRVIVKRAKKIATQKETKLVKVAEVIEKKKEQAEENINIPQKEITRYPSWSFAGVWNMSFNDENRTVEPRSHLWASELGKAPIDIFLSLKGTQPTNPPNERSKRKFEAGDVWEWIVELVLRRSGVLVDKQRYVKKCIPGMLEVTGRLDHVAGGKPDWERAQHELKELYLPPFISVRAENIINDLANKFPSGLKEIILEVKSTSTFMFDVYERRKVAGENHEMQIWHYLNGTDFDEGQIPYICRDDARIFTVPIWLEDKRIEKNYTDRVAKITAHWKADEKPEIEKPIVFDDMLLKFNSNWRIEYSQYLTMLYGYQTPSEYANQFKPMSSRFNRVIGRIAEGKAMTKNNLEAIEEMKVYYPEFEKHIDEIKKRKEELTINESEA